MDGNVCLRDGKGNYIDPITHEIIQKDRLVKFVQNNIKYCFDFMTLYKYSEDIGEYLNPFNRQPLSQKTIDLIEKLSDKFLINVTIIFYDITTNTTDDISSYAERENFENVTIEKIFDFVIEKTEEILNEEDILSCNIELKIDDENVNIYRSETITFGSDNFIVVKPYKTTEKFLNRVKRLKKRLSEKYRNKINIIENFINNIQEEVKNIKFSLEKGLYWENYNYSNILQMFDNIGVKFFFALTHNKAEIVDFFIERQLEPAVSFFLDAFVYGLNKNITNKILKSNATGLKILMFKNSNYCHEIVKPLENNESKGKIKYEILQMLVIYLNTNLSKNGIGYVRANFLENNEFIKFLIKKDYYDIIIALIKFIKIENIIDKIKKYASADSLVYKYFIS